MLFILVASLGLIAPNATALALTAGSALAEVGVLQLVIGAVAAPLIGLGGTTTMLTMASAIIAFGLATALTLLILGRPVSSPAPADDRKAAQVEPPCFH